MSFDTQVTSGLSDIKDIHSLRRERFFQRGFDVRTQLLDSDVDELNFLQLIIEGFSDPWSEIRKDTANLLHSILSQCNETIRKRLCSKVFVQISSEFKCESNSWQQLHGIFLGLKVCLSCNLLSVDALDGVMDVCVSHLSIAQEPVRETSEACVLLLYVACEVNARKSYLSLWIDEINLPLFHDN